MSLFALLFAFSIKKKIQNLFLVYIWKSKFVAVILPSRIIFRIICTYMKKELIIGFSYSVKYISKVNFLCICMLKMSFEGGKKMKTLNINFSYLYTHAKWTFLEFSGLRTQKFTIDPNKRCGPRPRKYAILDPKRKFVVEGLNDCFKCDMTSVWWNIQFRSQ